MHRSLLLPLALLLPALPLAAQEAPSKSFFEGRETVLFLGDSITQNGTYVALVEAYLWAAYPERDIEIVNVGQSGETASGDTEPASGNRRRPYLHNRLNRILKAVTPDLTFVCYGMNDGIYHPLTLEFRNHYQGGIRMAIDALHGVGSDIALLTSPPFDSASKKPENMRALDSPPFAYKFPYEGYDEVLVNYGEWILTRPYEVAYAIDIGNPVREWIKARREADPEFKHGDGVHPRDDGHLKMALALLAGAGEDAKKAEEILQQITGLTLFPEVVEEKTEKNPLLGKIQKRHRSLSGAYRSFIGGAPGEENPGANPVKLAEAIASAGAAEEEIRKAIAELMKAEPVPVQ